MHAVSRVSYARAPTAAHQDRSPHRNIQSASPPCLILAPLSDPMPHTRCLAPLSDPLSTASRAAHGSHPRLAAPRHRPRPSELPATAQREATEGCAPVCVLPHSCQLLAPNYTVDYRPPQAIPSCALAPHRRTLTISSTSTLDCRSGIDWSAVGSPCSPPMADPRVPPAAAPAVVPAAPAWAACVPHRQACVCVSTPSVRTSTDGSR